MLFALNLTVSLNYAPQVGGKRTGLQLPSTHGGDDAEASSNKIAGEGGGAGAAPDTYLDAPWVGGLVERVLHDLTDNLALGEDLGEVLGAQHVPEGGRRQQPSRVTE